MRICVRTWRRADSHRIGLSAAGVAYFSLLAVFPGLAALVAFYGLLRSPNDVMQQIEALSAVAPPEAVALAREQLMRLIAAPSQALAFSAALSLALALWAVNRGVAGFRGAMIALDERSERGRIVHQTLRSFVLTGSALATAVAVIALLAVLPAALAMLPISRDVAFVLAWARWPILLSAAIGYAASLYRWGVNRHARAWAVALPAAAAAAVAWLLVSFGLSQYVSQYAQLSETYGSLAGAVVLLLWLYLTAYVFLLGAEFSFVLENRREARLALREREAQRTACPASLDA